MFALITTLSTNLLRTYIIYRFMRLFFWTDIEEKKKERACSSPSHKEVEGTRAALNQITV